LIYLDTSVLVPLYWAEALSDSVEELLSGEAVEPAISQLVEVEFVSALSRRVRMGEVAQGEARAIVQQFQTDLEAGLYTQLALEPIHYIMARDWIHQFNTPLRTLDGLHLAIAVANTISLVTADEGLAESANGLGGCGADSETVGRSLNAISHYPSTPHSSTHLLPTPLYWCVNEVFFQVIQDSVCLG
jgi:predicted nucleic acid-binding protein